jgi:hypothetical protein
MSHEPAGLQEVHDFNNNNGDGPDPDDLHIDMNGPLTNGWNQHIISILVRKFKERRKTLSPRLRTARRPDAYIEKLITEKLQRCRSHWKAARPQRCDDGQWEGPEDLEARLVANKDEVLHRQRHLTRRINVSTVQPYSGTR